MPLEFTFKDGYRSDLDNWGTSGPRISDSINLDVIRGAFENGRTVVLEHKFYRGGRGPEYRVFDDLDFLREYLQEHCSAGDSIWVFDITESLKTGKELVRGKCPNQKGEVPEKGAY